MVEKKTAKPFLKWAGGKRQLLPQLDKLYPAALKTGSISNYYEPFVGSGAVFFDIAQRYSIKNAWLFDINPALIATYITIQEEAEKLVDALHKVEKKYLALNQEARTAFYYEQRLLFNRQTAAAMVGKNATDRVLLASRLIFLNHTCYNGLFRVNSKGAFNTPAGDYKNPLICDANNLLAVAGILQHANIRQADFRQGLKNIRPGAFVYIDPPYRPVSKTAHFTAYNQSVFADKQQTELAAIYRRLNKKGISLMLSNSATTDGFFDTLYQGFTVTRVPARRMINTNVSGRGVVNEIVVTNYAGA
jgi:DNA adenine methylase